MVHAIVPHAGPDGSRAAFRPREGFLRGMYAGINRLIAASGVTAHVPLLLLMLSLLLLLLLL